jgi:hypothetical protein
MEEILCINPTNAIQLLEAICERNEARELRLPSGRIVMVTPTDGLAALTEAIEDPGVRKLLGESVAQLVEGKLIPFEP